MSTDLFSASDKNNISAKSLPLAARMRPQKLEDFIGQEHLIGKGKLLRRAIEADKIGSIILYGPPGSGKTTLAQVIAETTHSLFVSISAVTSNVSELKQIASEAIYRRQANGMQTILFIDEIHRFNKAQQDILLPHVENGVLSLIGATTYNPFFYINAALVSRSKIFQLEPLSRENIKTILERALKDSEKGVADFNVNADENALLHIAEISEGDARKALNALEIAVLTTEPDCDGLRHIDLKTAEESIQKKAIVYDMNGDQHYDTISAFIKSLRGSDPDAALYWLAKMLYAGEDPRFIARRMVIFASEDIGNADPHALLVATSAYQAVDIVGLPEAQINLAQSVTYLATAPKSNASYLGIIKATEDVKNKRINEVPRHLRDTHYKGSKELGHGEGYKYAHEFEGHIVKQQYMPEYKTYYEPTDQGYEAQIARRLKYWKLKLSSNNKLSDEKAENNKRQ